MCTGTTRTCGNTCARGAGTHGDVLNLQTEVFGTDTRRRGRKGEGRGVTVSSAYQEKPTKSSHLAPQVHRKKPLDLTHSKFENRSRTNRSRVLQSFALPDEAVELHFILRDTTTHTRNTRHTRHTTQHNTHTHAPTHTHQPTHPPTHPTPLPSPPSPPPPPRTRTRKRTCTCTCICVYMHTYMCMYMYMYMCKCKCKCMCMCAYVYVYESVRVCARVCVYDLPQWFHVFLLHLLHIYIYIHLIYIYVYIC